MTPILNQQTITANGEYSFESFSVGDEVLIEWDITAGSATVEPGYVSLTGLFKPARDLTNTKPAYTNTEGGQLCIELGNSAMAAIKVTNAAGLSMKVCQSKVRK